MSNITPILVTGTLTPSGIQDVNVVSPLPLPVAGMFTPSGTQDINILSQSITVAISAASLPLPTGAATESSLSALNLKIPANLTVSSTRLLVDGSGVTQPISGSVSVSNFPVTQPISGTVTTNQGTSPWIVSGTVAATQSTNPWIISGTVTANAGTGNFTVVQSSGANLHVAVDNFPATQPISGTVTALQGTSPWVISGTVVANAGTGTFLVDGSAHTQPISGTVTANAGTGTMLVDGSAHTQPISGSVSVSNFPATQPISAVSLPLPTGAATETTLGVLNSNIAKSYGTWTYYAGTSGTVSVTAGQRVLSISCHCTTAGTITINSGASIPVPANVGFSVDMTGLLTAPTVVFTGTDSYFIEAVS